MPLMRRYATARSPIQESKTGLDRLLELLARVGREVVERLEAARQLAQRVGVQVGVERRRRARA
jgi:hypothetical protein